MAASLLEAKGNLRENYGVQLWSMLTTDATDSGWVSSDFATKAAIHIYASSWTAATVTIYGSNDQTAPAGDGTQLGTSITADTMLLLDPMPRFIKIKRSGGVGNVTANMRMIF